VKILVPCKRVPNPDLKLKVANGSVDLASTTWQVNPFDEYAVETALRLTEKGKGGERVGEVVVVSIGPKDTAAQLKQLLAMGANRANVVRLVLRGAFLQILIGLLIGIPASIGCSRLIASQLYEVKGWDPIVLGGSVVALAVCALLASIVPARRAASINPVLALRAE